MKTPSAILFLAITWLSRNVCVRAGPIRTSSDVLFVSNGWPFGTGNTQVCPPGSLARGFRVKFDEYDHVTGNGDRRGMTGIELKCYDVTAEVVTSGITSDQAASGSWSADWAMCDRGHYLTSFALRVQGYLGAGDDTSVNNIQFECLPLERDFDEIGNVIQGQDGGAAGDYGGRSGQCNPGSAICGLKTKIDDGSQGDGDWTGLNDVVFFCC